MLASGNWVHLPWCICVMPVNIAVGTLKLRYIDTGELTQSQIIGCHRLS